MLDFSTFLIFIAILLLSYWLLRNPSKLPPGPSRWQAMQLARPNAKVQNTLLEWCREYKDLCTINLIGGQMIFVNNFDLIKKLFVQNAEYFSERPNFWLVNYLTKGKGIIFNLTSWKQTRRFALHSLRDFGLGKQSLDERIQEEAKNLVEQFRSKNGQAFDPQDDMTKTVSNIICSITFGKRYKYSDPEFALVLGYVQEVFNRRLNFSSLNNLPWLRHFGFLNNMLNVEYFEEPIRNIKEFVSKEIMKHRETYDPDNIRDLVDLYLQAEQNDVQDKEWMDERNLFYVIIDLFLAGTDTTTGTLRWLLLHLVNNPDVQKKCQDEIYKVVGTEKLPEYRDRNNFPYIIATIQEALRIDTVVLGSLMHVAGKDFEIGEYVIPKGTTVMAITRGIMHDPKIWGDDVDKFRPERWLDEEGKVRNVPEFLPFSIGKRVCLGEQLTRTELFIDTVALLQRFTFHPEDPENPPKPEGVIGSTYVPLPFQIVATPV